LHCHVRGNEKLFVDVYAKFIEPLIIKNTGMPQVYLK
ncbi:type III secretion system LEE GrlA-binding negative regulator GrlR, partial [Escherichia coli]|nr:type III secretion system LEE GrlA-binding negative regulator GrlR [Escherichia coli]EEY0793709.1 type III secretion system LEE GrlA-binding negative regulator GrlR [Escherichia coli]EGY7471761.1 type III secretion system LEE GrlA-binding negative regulator GrlR [Escherichia coli]